MATQVRETKAGRAISAFLVLNKKGEHVATVNAHYADSGRVSVDVWNIGQRAVDKCLVSAAVSGSLATDKLENAIKDARTKRDWVKPEDLKEWAAYDLFGLQQCSAGGGGYDKFTAALRGIWIDGVQLVDHCGNDAKSEKLLKAYTKDMAALKAQWLHEKPQQIKDAQKAWDAKAEKMGASFSNYDADKGCYTSLHIRAGLDRLTSMGWNVIQAI